MESVAVILGTRVTAVPRRHALGGACLVPAPTAFACACPVIGAQIAPQKYAQMIAAGRELATRFRAPALARPAGDLRTVPKRIVFLDAKMGRARTATASACQGLLVLHVTNESARICAAIMVTVAKTPSAHVIPVTRVRTARSSSATRTATDMALVRRESASASPGSKANCAKPRRALTIATATVFATNHSARAHVSRCGKGLLVSDPNARTIATVTVSAWKAVSANAIPIGTETLATFRSATRTAISMVSV